MDKFALNRMVRMELEAWRSFLTQQLLRIWDNVSQGTQIFQKSRIDVMIPCARVVTSIKFHAEDNKYW